MGGSALERLLHEQMEKRAALANNDFQLPTVAAPSLDGLEVTVDAPPPPSAEEATRLWVSKLRGIAPRTPRAAGERVAQGDELQLDMIAWMGNTLVPFSLRHAQWVFLEAMPLLPGLMETLLGQPVGMRKWIPVTLPPTYPAPDWRGQTISIDVRLIAARSLLLPSPTDPASLEKLGFASTGDAQRAIWTELEARASAQMRIEAENKVLDELVARSRPEVPNGIVDEEIRRRWKQTEGAWAAGLGLPLEIQEQSLAGWLRDHSTRADAERRIQIGLVLRAISIRDQVTLVEADLRALLQGVVQALGTTLEEVGASLRTEPASVERIVETAIHLRVVQHVMKHARVHERRAGASVEPARA